MLALAKAKDPWTVVNCSFLCFTGKRIRSLHRYMYSVPTTVSRKSCIFHFEVDLERALRHWLDSEDCPQAAIPTIDPSTTSECGSSDASVEPAGMHLAVSKCIGAHKEFHYQEILALVVKKIKQGETVPVTCRVQREPLKQPSWLTCHCLWMQSEWSVGEDWLCFTCSMMQYTKQ